MISDISEVVEQGSRIFISTKGEKNSLRSSIGAILDNIIVIEALALVPKKEHRSIRSNGFNIDLAHEEERMAKALIKNNPYRFNNHRSVKQYAKLRNLALFTLQYAANSPFDTILNPYVFFNNGYSVDNLSIVSINGFRTGPFLRESSEDVRMGWALEKNENFEDAKVAHFRILNNVLHSLRYNQCVLNSKKIIDDSYLKFEARK